MFRCVNMFIKAFEYVYPVKMCINVCKCIQMCIFIEIYKKSEKVSCNISYRTRSQRGASKKKSSNFIPLQNKLFVTL